MLNNTGRFCIESKVSMGMIRLGINLVSIFNNNGIVIENRGTIIFKGRATIGNDSAISVGEKGVVTIGENFLATAALKLVSYYNITIERDVLVGWNTMMCDNDFHRLRKIGSDQFMGKGYGSIYIGSSVWIANGCKLYHGVSIPDKCVVGADTILHKPVECPDGSLIINSRGTVVTHKGAYHDMNHDGIEE